MTMVTEERTTTNVIPLTQMLILKLINGYRWEEMYVIHILARILMDKPVR